MENKILSKNEIIFHRIANSKKIREEREKKRKENAFNLACKLSNQLKIKNKVYSNVSHDPEELILTKSILFEHDFLVSLQKGCRDYSCDHDDYGPPYDSWTCKHEPGETPCKIRHRAIYRLEVTL